MNRLTAYATTSVALTGSILVHAFLHRPNFYSAAVYLSQSNACLLILANFLLLVIGSIYYGLQRLCYGRLRPVEVEQLYERGWYQATELCLAATIFRDEVGWGFGALFLGNLAGKIWGWLAESRVEMMQQQPPANPRVFHTRLVSSLIVGLLFDVLVLRYCVDTVLEQARPGMFVMFSFEFAVLGIQQISTTLRYLICVREQLVIQEQQKQRVVARRAEARVEREREVREAQEQGREPSPYEEEDVDPTEEDVPGWETKGTWLFGLDLATDFIKSLLYLTFFSILLVFHGFPVHIIRDLILTVRSLFSRISGFVAYRTATKAMNTLPDASAQDLSQDKTCIVCREDMQLWDANGPVPVEGEPAQRQQYIDERQRPKKLPCGHILHKGCLKAWLERQQTCPTCRRPVLPTHSVWTNQQNANPQQPGQPGQPGQAAQPGHAPWRQPGAPANGPAGHPAPQGGNAGQNQQRPQAQGWRFNFGPLRLFIGRGPADLLQDRARLAALAGNPDLAQQLQENAGVPQNQNQNLQTGAPAANQTRGLTQGPGLDPQSRAAIYRQERIEQLQNELHREIQNLTIQNQQLAVVRGLQNEWLRLSALQSRNAQLAQGQQPLNYVPQNPLGFPGSAITIPTMPQLPAQLPALFGPGQEPMSAGSPQLPEGMVLPEGWTVLPLSRVPDAPVRHTELPQHLFNINTPDALSPWNLPPGVGLPSLPRVTTPANATMAGPTVPFDPNGAVAGSSAMQATPVIASNSTNPPTATTSNIAPQPVNPQSTPPLSELISQLASAQEAAANSSTLEQSTPVPTSLQQPVPTSTSGATSSWNFNNARPSSTGPSSPTEKSQDNDSTQSEDSEKDTKGKGKAKAATVEDGSDAEMD